MTKFPPGNAAGAKVSNEEVFEMRQLYTEGWTQPQLARRYGLHINTVGRIVRGESRQGVPRALPEEDHQAAQQRLAALQAERQDGIVGRALQDAQAIHDQATKVDKSLDELTNWPAAERFGVVKGDPQ